VRDQKAKTGCVTVDIRSDGEVRAFNHGGGSVIPVYEGCRTNCMQFIQNQDKKKLHSWTIGCASPTCLVLLHEVIIELIELCNH